MKLPDSVTARRILYLGIAGHLALGASHLLLNPQRISSQNQYAFELVILLGIPGGMLLALRGFERTDPQPGDYLRLVLWGVTGTATMLLIAGLYFLDLRLAAVTATHTEFALIAAADTGALFGLVIGWQEVRVRYSARRVERAETRAELSKRHEQSHAFLNRILRHYMLNGMSIILGHASTLMENAREDQRAPLETIESRGQEMVEYIHDIQVVVSGLAGEIQASEINVSVMLNQVVQNAKETHPDIEIESAISPDVTAVGTDLLDTVFDHLVENAAKHNDTESARIDIQLTELPGTIRVTVSDNGPGIPDTLKTAYFQRGSHGEASLGEGLGLYLAETVVTTIGGRIWIEDNEPRGTRIAVELPRSLADASPGDQAAVDTAD